MNRFLLLIKEILKLHAKCIVGFFWGDIWTLRLYIRKGGGISGNPFTIRILNITEPL